MSRSFILRAPAVALLLVSAVALAQQQGGRRQGGQSQAGPGQPTPGRSDRPANGAAAGDKPPLETFEEKLSYALGVNTARRMRLDGVEPEPRNFSRGILDGFANKSLMTDEEMTAILQRFDQQLKDKAEAARKQRVAEWETSFSEEKPKTEEKTTSGGLKYEVFERGEGPKPTAADVAVFHYVGRLAKDGKVFESTVERGEPMVYPVKDLLPGLVEGLQLMPVGSKYRFHVRADLAYGEQGLKDPRTDQVRIGPNEDLVFEVQLLEVAPQEQAPPGGRPAPPEGDAPEETPAPPRE